MPVKKSEIYSPIWESCDELRGGMDASQYKDYVLVLLFMKYVSDRCAGKKDVLIQVPAGASFADMIALKGKPEIGDGINKIIAKLSEIIKAVSATSDIATLEFSTDLPVLIDFQQTKEGKLTFFLAPRIEPE